MAELHAAPFKLRKLADAVDAGEFETQLVVALVIHGEAEIRVCNFGGPDIERALNTVRLGRAWRGKLGVKT